MSGLLLRIVFENWLCILLVGEALRMAFILRGRFDLHSAGLISLCPYGVALLLNAEWGPLPAVLIAGGIIALVNVLIDRLIAGVSPNGISEGAEGTLISVGLMFAIVNLVVWTGGSSTQILGQGVSGADGSIGPVAIVSAGALILSAAALRRPLRIGTVERAALTNRTLLLLQGFPLARIAMVAAFGGGAAIAFAAVLRASGTAFSPFVGLELTLLGVAAAYAAPDRGLIGVVAAALVLALIVAWAEYGLDGNWPHAVAFFSAGMLILARAVLRRMGRT